MNISSIIKEDNFFKDNDKFNFDEALEDCQNIKYRKSKFFMAFYEIYKENYKSSEDERFKQSINNYRNVLIDIITMKEKNIKFFEINNHNEILNVINTIQNDDLKNEINFTVEEFKDLNKEDYIKNELSDDLINYSKKDNASKLLQGIKRFIKTYKEIVNIELTEFDKEIENLYFKIEADNVNKEEIKEIINILLEKGFDINNETPFIKFCKSLKEGAFLFLRDLKNDNLEIRNLNEFVVESAASELQTSDIDNLFYVFEFFLKIFNIKEIETDKSLIDIFGKELNNSKEIWMRFDRYQKIYGEIKRVYQLFHDNPTTTNEKISQILKKSVVDIYKNETNLITFEFTYTQKTDNGEKIQVDKIKDLEELKNKILLSSNNTRMLNGQNEEEIIDKKILSKNFVNLIDNIKQLTLTLNNLLHIGYPHILNLKLYIENLSVKGDDGRELKNIMADYKKINNTFKNSLKDAYEKFPFLRLFYGQQFIQLYNRVNKVKNNNEEENKIEEDEEEQKEYILHLINSVSLNRANNMEIDYKYNEEINEFENINNYLEKVFQVNDIQINQLFEQNKVLEKIKLSPGLYRKVKSGDNADIINNILNIYINLTNNPPIINTLLICNEHTSLEKIQSFLYRAIFCDMPILFVISNLECLELSIIRNIINIFKSLYKEKKNKIVNSYILILYEKAESGLARFLEKFIPEKNNFDNSYLSDTEKKCEVFNNIELYSAEFSGYGKTTEIKNKIKEKNGKYNYLPIGGTITRDYIIDNLKALQLDLKNGKENFLHIDLSETDNDDLMIETLFNLLILRYIDSKTNIYYLGFDINFMIEIPKCAYKFDDKYKLLRLFNKIHISELKPLRLEENIHKVGDSPISIVAEVLDLYDKNIIDMKNIDLDAPITKTAEECEKIINKYFNVENQSYYQKMNFIKILAIQFKNFTNDIYLNVEFNEEKGMLLVRARKTVIYNFIELTKVFTRSPYDSVLLAQDKSIKIFGKINDEKAKEEEIMKMADESNKQEIFSFEKIKPSLVFFNKDNESLSIISNNDDKEENYKQLRLLWSSNKPEIMKLDLEALIDVINLKNMKILDELVNYKELSHEQFLEQVQKIFNLKMSVEEIKLQCEKLGNYIFVSDNFIKMVRILLNIEAKIPVILMGETGVGKTKLLEMLAALYGNGKPKWHKLQIHAGITDQKIVRFIDNLNNLYKAQEKNGEKIWIFFDEINTCNSLGLISEIMCNHTYLGKKINDNFVFLAACNPYRVITKKMKESGLVYYNLKDKNKLDNLVYTVNPLPHSLLNFIFDFGSLKPEDEKKYITNTIIDIISRFKSKNIIKDFDKIDEEDLKTIKKKIIESIVICHDFMREKYDRSSVSLREIRRFGIFFEYFIKYFNKNNYESLKDSLNMTLYLCYYLRLNEKKYRDELSTRLENIFDDFLKVPENIVKLITDEMTLEEDGGIAKNRALRENLFTCFICIDNSVPLIIVGKPGTGKSLSFQILYNTLKGEYSESKMFKEKGKLYRYYYQGSGTSTSEGIQQVFDKALAAKKNSEKSKNKIITLVFFDEMGLAERSLNNPLKIIHYLLEKDIEDSVPFLGISNWKLDAAKINRALNLSITDYAKEDLEDTAIHIAQALDKDIATESRNRRFFEILADTYHKYMEDVKNSLKENRDFHGNRDFYNLIKTATRELIERKIELNDNRKRILTEA